MEIYMVYGIKLQQSVYFVINDGKAVVIDCGITYETLKQCEELLNVKVIAVLLTHGHIDHIVGAKDAFDNGLPVYIHEEDNVMLCSEQSISRIFHIKVEPFSSKNQLVGADGTISLPPFDIRFIQTKGHSVGSVCYMIGDKLFSGDTLFKGSYGSTEFPGGNMDDIAHSLFEILFKLPPDTEYYSGHYPFNLARKSEIIGVVNGEKVYKIYAEGKIGEEIGTNYIYTDYQN